MSNVIVSLWRAQTFEYLAYHLSWFLFGFSLCGVLVLIVIFMTSQGLPKMDFVRKLVVLSVLEVLPVVPFREVKPFPIWFYLPLLGNDFFSSYSCSARCGDFNEPKNIENGVRMQKLWRFSCRCLCSFWVGRNLRP